MAMKKNAPLSAGQVYGPYGDILTFYNLPNRETTRWVSRRKAELVAAVRQGLLSFEDACARYKITPEELISWQDAMNHAGVQGLCATKARDCRR